MFHHSIFSEIRSARLCFIAGFVGLHLLLKAIFFSPGFLSHVADPVYDLTGGFVTHSATAGLIEITILFVFLLL